MTNTTKPALSAAPVEPELISGAEMDAIEAAAIAGKPLTSTDRDLAERQLPQTFQDELKDLRLRASPVAQEPVAEHEAQQQTHVLERTSPKGPGSKFLGKCILCGEDNLPLRAAQEICGNPDAVSTDSAVVMAVNGPPATPAGLGADEISFFQAVADGYSGKIEHGCLIVENPKADPQSLALGGVSPNLVLDATAILALLSRGSGVRSDPPHEA